MDNVENVKKRFIAGAVCPKCAMPDTLVMYRLDDGDYRECVECGFEDKLLFEPQVRELTTRVNVSDEQKKQETQVINIIDPPKRN